MASNDSRSTKIFLIALDSEHSKNIKFIGNSFEEAKTFV
jgi:hypothetical protein